VLSYSRQETLTTKTPRPHKKRSGHFEYQNPATLRVAVRFSRGNRPRRPDFFSSSRETIRPVYGASRYMILHKSQESRLPPSVDFSRQQVAGDSISTSSAQVSVQGSHTSGGAVPARENERVKQGTRGSEGLRVREGEFGGASAYPVRPTYGPTTGQGKFGQHQVEASGWDRHQYDDFRQGEPRRIPTARHRCSTSHQPEGTRHEVQRVRARNSSRPPKSWRP
jgi:hypothetical protein